ncbi:hypothetical protein ACFCY8_11345 [Streptomyces noursei]|uniref:hypothetical protein n=1 Tax=Streptomyces noursei TaxID=1971 RepID=UPI0035DD4CB7
MGRTGDEGNIDGFLRDLKRLTKRYGLAVGGCGCMGSPFLAQIKGGKVVYENLTYCRVHEGYGTLADHSGCEG